MSVASLGPAGSRESWLDYNIRQYFAWTVVRASWWYQHMAGTGSVVARQSRKGELANAGCASDRRISVHRFVLLNGILNDRTAQERERRYFPDRYRSPGARDAPVAAPFHQSADCPLL